MLDRKVAYDDSYNATCSAVQDQANISSCYYGILICRAKTDSKQSAERYGFANTLGILVPLVCRSFELHAHARAPVTRSELFIPAHQACVVVPGCTP